MTKKEVTKMVAEYNKANPTNQFKKCLCKQKNIDKFIILYDKWVNESKNDEDEN